MERLVNSGAENVKTDFTKSRQLALKWRQMIERASDKWLLGTLQDFAPVVGRSTSVFSWDLAALGTLPSLLFSQLFVRSSFPNEPYERIYDAYQANLCNDMCVSSSYPPCSPHWAVYSYPRPVKPAALSFTRAAPFPTPFPPWIPHFLLIHIFSFFHRIMARVIVIRASKKLQEFIVFEFCKIV